MKRDRIVAVDWLRGVVMVLMALDHVRYFFTSVPFAPENLEKTWPALFLTRWVTHFCAPSFFLLAGMGAALGNARPRLLVTRGLWLVVLELTVIGFAWQFTPGYSFAGVIQALGWSMVALAALSYLPRPILLVTSLLTIAIDVSDGAPNLLFRPGAVRAFGFEWYVLFPIVPWLAIMVLGYAIAPLWNRSKAERQRILLAAGCTATALFLILRLRHVEGSNLLAILNTRKYPPSLEFTLMTIGPALIVLALADRWLRRERSVTRTFGRVPFFFYLCHLYLIHLLALGIATVSGQPHAWLGWDPPAGPVPPPGYGFDLPVIWLLWIAVVALLYLPCRWFERIKREHDRWWLVYL